MDKNCTVCAKVFSAKRSTAKFCSVACKLKYNRDIKDDTEITQSKPVSAVQKCPKCGFGQYDPTNEWSHSACFKTQEEIEEHYTLANFPSVKYHSSGGGGSGSRSPYPVGDPRSKAYV